MACCLALGSVPASAADNAPPDFDGNARPGDNLYTATLLAIEPKTGKQLMTHLNKGGFVTVLDRMSGKVENV